MSSQSIFGPVTRPVGLETELGVLRPGDAWANPVVLASHVVAAYGEVSRPGLTGPDGAPAGMSAGFWGSLLPAAWSFMLALRSRGLGSAWTTLHLMGDGEKQAADVLGIPFEKYSQGGLFPIAYTKGTDFKPARRLPAEQLTHWNTW